MNKEEAKLDMLEQLIDVLAKFVDWATEVERRLKCLENPRIFAMGGKTDATE